MEQMECMIYSLYYMSRKALYISTKYSTLVHTYRKEEIYTVISIVPIYTAGDVGDRLSLVHSILYKERERDVMCCVHVAGTVLPCKPCILSVYIHATDTVEWFACPQIRSFHTSGECVWSME